MGGYNERCYLEEAFMAQEDIPRDTVIRRLRRIEGQVRGIQKMVAEGRECENVITQLVAVRSAIDGVGSLVLNNYMRLCFSDGTDECSATVSSLARSVAIWGRVRSGNDL